MLIGGDGRCNGKDCLHIIGDEAWMIVSESLQSGLSTIPSSWGRSPLALSKVSSYKAEDWKTMGVCYGPALFNTRLAGPNASHLWSMTSQMLHIFFDACPPRSDIETLRSLLAQSLKLFADIFCQHDDHAFCYTPTTHALTHLHENLRQCGPLVNVSQHIMERLIGQLGAGVKSWKLPETQMLSSHHMQFHSR